MQVAIVKYNAGNVYSVVNAMRRLGVEPLLTDDAEQLMKADRVLFPGQGEASGAMKYLKERRLDEVIRSLRQPVLGICIGQQLLCRHSEEGDVDCIGIFDADVKRFQPSRHEDKVPCMGWNWLKPTPTPPEGRGSVCPLFSGMLEKASQLQFSGMLEKASQLQFSGMLEKASPLQNGESDILSPSLGEGLGWAYFVHSYYVPLCEDTAAVADYILPYSAALHKDNFYTCQFHPEKSGKVGEQILRNFLALK